MNASDLDVGNVIAYPSAQDGCATVVNLWDPSKHGRQAVDVDPGRFLAHLIYRRADGQLETTWVEFEPNEYVAVVCEAFQLQGVA